jgi:hypothetical protein
VNGPELALPDGYRELLEDLKRSVAAARWHYTVDIAGEVAHGTFGTEGACIEV